MSNWVCDWFGTSFPGLETRVEHFSSAPPECPTQCKKLHDVKNISLWEQQIYNTDEESEEGERTGIADLSCLSW